MNMYPKMSLSRINSHHDAYKERILYKLTPWCGVIVATIALYLLYCYYSFLFRCVENKRISFDRIKHNAYTRIITSLQMRFYET